MKSICASASSHIERSQKIRIVLVCLLPLAAPVVASQTIEEVVVTAQRRAESMQAIPLAVSAISADDVNVLGWDRPNEIAAQVPNMQVTTPYGHVQPLFAIRGISMVDYAPSQASPIGVYLDEGYIGATWLHGMAMFDLERIEVLRGPQGTLYGKNTTGGAINLISMTPDIDDPASGHITVGAADFGMMSVDAAAEATLVDDKLAARIAVRYKEDDGYWKNSAGPTMAQTDYVSSRLTLNYEPNDRLSTLLKLTYGFSDGRSTPPQITATAGPGITLAGRPSNTDRHAGAINKVGNTEIGMTVASLKLSYDWANYSLESVTSHYDADYFQVQDVDGTTALLAGINWAADTNAFTQELRLVSNFDSRFSFIAGLYYGKEETHTNILHDQIYADPAVGPTLTALALGAAATDPLLGNHLLVLASALPQLGQVDRRFDVERESLAAYANFDFDVSSKIRIGLGVRYTDETNTRKYINYSRLDHAGNPVGSWIPGNLLEPLFNSLGVDSPLVTFALSQAVALPAGTFLDGPYTLNSGDNRERSEGEFSGKVSASLQIADSAMIYASYSRGYRSGSFNNGLVYSDQPDENGTYANPEFVDAFEAGFKGDLLGERMRFNAAIFYYDYRDQQFANQIGISAQLVNAGGAEIKGAELELTALLTDRLTVRADVGLLNAEFNTLSLPRLSTALNTLDSIDLSGNTPVSSPDVNFNYAIDYEMPVRSNWSMQFNINGNYVDDQWFSAYNDQDGHSEIRQKAYWLHNARVTLQSVDERLAFSIFGKNIFDQAYDVFAINLQGGFGFNYFLEAPPGFYGAEFTYRY